MKPRQRPYLDFQTSDLFRQMVVFCLQARDSFVPAFESIPDLIRISRRRMIVSIQLWMLDHPSATDQHIHLVRTGGESEWACGDPLPV